MAQEIVMKVVYCPHRTGRVGISTTQRILPSRTVQEMLNQADDFITSFRRDTPGRMTVTIEKDVPMDIPRDVRVE